VLVIDSIMKTREAAMKQIHTLKYACALVLAALSSMSFNAYAEEAPAAAVEPTPDWTFPMSVSLVSDYIFRGQSQTWGRPAAQFAFEADHKSGFYAGFFLSNVSDHWLPGAKVETDLYGGYRGKLTEDVGFDVGGIYYMYPGADWDESAFDGFNASNKVDTFEAYAALTYKWLTFKTGITLNEYFGWSTNNSPVNGGFAGDLDAGVTGDTSGSYFFELNAAYEVVPTWTVSGQIGRQEINNSKGLDITYYKAGVTKALPHGFSLGAFYSGSNEPDAYEDFISLDNARSDSDIARDTVFVTLTKSF
jgi:uncharacterized protein (TIGR02001 family)